MTTQDWVLLGDGLVMLGLLAGTAAGVMLGYDAVVGAGARFQAQVAADRLTQLRKFRADSRQKTRSLPSPPWTKEEIKAFLDEEEQEWAPREEAARKRADELPLRHENKVAILALNGVLLLIAAFLLQLIGTVIIAIVTYR